jgi:hypothetical protein
MALQFDTTTRNNMLDQITSRVGASGVHRHYSGTIPANVAAAITGTLLAELTANATFAPAASSGVLTLNAITQDSSADNTGTVSHFRQWQSNGTTGVFQGTVGTSSTDIVMNTVSYVAAGPVAVTSATITAPGA